MARLVCPVRAIETFIRHSLGTQAACIPARLPRASLRTRSRYLTTRTPLSAVSQGILQSDKLPSQDASHVRETPSDSLLSSIEAFRQTNTVEQDADANIRFAGRTDEKLENDTSPGTKLASEHNVQSGAEFGKHSSHNSTVDVVSLPSLKPFQDSRKVGKADAHQQNLTVTVPLRSREERRKERKLRRLKAKKETREAKAARRKPAPPGPKRFTKAKNKVALEEAHHTNKAKNTSNNTSEAGTGKKLSKAYNDTYDADIEGEQVASMLKDVHRAAAARDMKPKEGFAEFTGRRYDGSSQALQPIDKRAEVQKPKEEWQIQKAALKKKFGDQPWNPRKRISPDAIAGVKSLHASDPATYSTERLSQYFQISPDAVRRILKSSWQPNEEEVVHRRERWERRGERKWSELAAEGVKPPRKWRERGIGTEDMDEGQPKTRWRRSEVSTKGERWIEHRSPDDLFAMAAQTQPARSGRRAPAVRMSDRFL